MEYFSTTEFGFVAERVEQLVDSKQIGAVADINDDVPYSFGQEVRQPQCCDGIAIQVLHFLLPLSFFSHFGFVNICKSGSPVHSGCRIQIGRDPCHLYAEKLSGVSDTYILFFSKSLLFPAALR